MNELYNGCNSAEDVDRITSLRINQLHGNVPGDELKNLRRGMLAIFSMLRPSLFDQKSKDALLSYGDKLLVMNARIENIVTEASTFKKEKGW